jgi:hypothetical protein
MILVWSTKMYRTYSRNSKKTNRIWKSTRRNKRNRRSTV